MSNNNEVCIYQRLWYNFRVVLVGLAFVAIGIFMWVKDGSEATLLNKVICILTIVFFGGGALVMAYTMFRQKMRGLPMLVVDDKGVTYNYVGGSDFIDFNDVDHFDYCHIGGAKWLGYVDGTNLIAVVFKDKALKERYLASSAVRRMGMRLGEQMAGVAYGLPAEGMTMRRQELLELLNNRLEASQTGR